MESRYFYRGKRIDNGKWKQGYLYGIWERKYILWGMTNDIPDMVEVDPSTICQCTGLKDKNGNLIWENDIVKRKFRLYSGETKYEEKENCGVVKYDKEYARFGYQCSVFAMVAESRKHDTFEVIGNTFDNPKLLEV